MTKWIAVLGVVLALLLYLRSPLDLVPDRFGPIGLLDDLAVIVAAIWWISRRLARDGRRRPGAPPRDTDEATEDAGWDPYAVLGVTPGASADEITQAYREQMKRYHPDRVAHLGEELREVAHRKTLEIQRAYAEIGPP